MVNAASKAPSLEDKIDSVLERQAKIEDLLVDVIEKLNNIDFSGDGFSVEFYPETEED